MPAICGEFTRNGPNANKLVHVGNVGTGVSAKLARDLKKQLDGIRIDKPSGKTLVFTEPKLVAEVTFGAWTPDGKLRHTSFKGLTEVTDHAEVYNLTAKEEGDG